MRFQIGDFLKEFVISAGCSNCFFGRPQSIYQCNIALSQPFSYYLLTLHCIYIYRYMYYFHFSNCFKKCVMAKVWLKVGFFYYFGYLKVWWPRRITLLKLILSVQSNVFVNGNEGRNRFFVLKQDSIKFPSCITRARR